MITIENIKNDGVVGLCFEMIQMGVRLGLDDPAETFAPQRNFMERTFREICDFFGIHVDTPDRLVLVSCPSVGISITSGRNKAEWMVAYDPKQGLTTDLFETHPMLSKYDWSDPITRHRFILAHEVWHRKQEVTGTLRPQLGGGIIFEGEYLSPLFMKTVPHDYLPHEIDAHRNALRYLKAKSMMPPLKGD